MKTDFTPEVKKTVPSKLPWIRGLEPSPQGSLKFAEKDLTAALTHDRQRPFFLLSLDVVKSRAEAFRNRLQEEFKQPLHFHFAVKSNNHPRLMQTLADAGFGADVVSGGERAWAVKHGFPSERVVFSGVAKTRVEIQSALQEGVGQLNVESFPELQRITEIAKSLSKKVRIAIRVNPEVRAETHPYIATGFRENKFGVDFLDFPQMRDWILAHPNEIDFQGMSLHIGSQLLDFSALEEALEKTRRLEEETIREGLLIKALDVGGGVGVSYKGSEEDDLATLEKYAGSLKRALSDYRNDLRFEPGRFWVARAGVLVSRVEYVKRTPHKNFLIINTGMNALLRPMLYQAYHRTLPSVQREGRSELFDVVGPVCESSDVIGTLREFHAPEEGDFICIGETGAYGRVLSSDYNLLGDVPELIWEDFVSK